jgi:hypothetical protein
VALNNQRGQTVVEYILLLTVGISLVYTFYRSQAYQRLFGENGSIGQAIKTESEFNYRHAYPRKATDINQVDYSGTSHPSYYDSTRGATRFFGPKEPYP